ncbi:MAG: sugar phosphate isomerase/epimerase [Spirochaetes bacterium]|nr:sugar phosphate isomerase/epimerase [Spirochaetota bacterium]
MLKFGLRAHDFGRGSPEEVAEALAPFGISSIQLALAKAFTGTAPEPGFMSQGYAAGIRQVFAAKGIDIAVLGCYINPVHPDSDELERQLRRFKEHLRFAGDFGCPVVGTETGSIAPDASFHPGTSRPETFDRLCASVERLLRTAERSGVIVGIEPVADQHTISTIGAARKLIERLDSPALGIIFDPVNLIPSTGLSGSQTEFFEEALAAFGDRIVAVHAKDFRLEGGRKSAALPAGSGELDYETLFSMLRLRGYSPDVLLEDASPTTAPAALAFLRAAAGAS